MADDARVEVGAHATFRRQISRPRADIEGCLDRCRSIEVRDGRERRIDAPHPIVVRAERREGRHVRRQIDLRLHHREDVRAGLEAPGLCGWIAAGVWRPWQLHARAKRQVWRDARDVLRLVTEIGRQPEPVATIVEAERRQRPLIGVVLKLGASRPEHPVEADAEFLVRTEPPADIGVCAELAGRDVARRPLGKRLIGCPLWLDVHRAADRAQWSHAAQHGARALEDIDALGEFRHGRQSRHDVEQTAEGPRARVDGKAADVGAIGTRAGRRTHGPDRGIVGQDLLNALGLLILGFPRRVAGLVERRIHDRAFAQQAHLGARRDLSAGIRRWQVVDHRL